MQKVTVTRMELLAKKEQIELASQGLELLKQKRAALLRELMRIADRVMARSDALQETAVTARLALARAEVRAGTAAVRSAAMAARGELQLEIRSANVMGVRVPDIEQKRVSRSVLGRGYAICGTAVTIDEAAAAFEAEIDCLIELARSQLRLEPLTREIQRTSRRANALEHIVLPRLIEERNYIEMALDERERADHFRFKRVKRMRQKGRRDEHE
ncbi:MAG: V-type ATP synthase subunit D [Ardenticatenaceae bacterium]|nr:V-type ATP synthase subunit D [Ardenticatenaceae bacterium]MCB9445095.1 V-type ATP synthase subunit D [Ardenticatenaceae bacterium]